VAVRLADVADADAIAAVHGRAWHLAYEDILPYDQLTKYDQDERRTWWTAVLRGDHDSHVLVTTTADDVIRGFAAYGAARDEDRAGDGELYAMYVDPAAQGAGLGSVLLAAVVDRLRAGGFAHAVLWVYEENGHGRTFYGERGWLPDGEPRMEDDWSAPGVRLRRAL
jgi:GNAT superfamily N-acetyltransferase